MGRRGVGGRMLRKAAWTLASVIVKSIWEEQCQSKALFTSSCLIFHGKLALGTGVCRNAWSCAIARSPWPGWLPTCHRPQRALLCASAVPSGLMAPLGPHSSLPTASIPPSSSPDQVPGATNCVDHLTQVERGVLEAIFRETTTLGCCFAKTS